MAEEQTIEVRIVQILAQGFCEFDPLTVPANTTVGEAKILALQRLHPTFPWLTLDKMQASQMIQGQKNLLYLYSC